MALTRAQARSHETGIGSSEIAALIGVRAPGGQTPLEIWQRKRSPGRAPLVVDQMSHDERLVGSILEPAVLRLYEHRTHTSVVRPNRAYRSRSGAPFVASPDALVSNGLAGPHQVMADPKQYAQRIVEVKCVGFFALRDWYAEEHGELTLPAYVRCQVEWQMMVLEVSSVDVVVMTGATTPPSLIPVDADKELQQELAEVARHWWRDYVEADVPPPMAEWETQQDYFARRFPRVERPAVTAEELGSTDEKFAAYLKRRRYLNTMAETYEQELDEIDGELKELIGTHRAVVGPWGSVSWEERRGAVSYKQLAEEVLGGPPSEQMKDHFRGAPFRVFSVKSKDNGNESENENTTTTP